MAIIATIIWPHPIAMKILIFTFVAMCGCGVIAVRKKEELEAGRGFSFSDLILLFTLVIFKFATIGLMIWTIYMFVAQTTFIP